MAWTYTSDLSDGFFAKLAAACGRLQCDPIDLLRVMRSESGVRADACNPNGHASGLFQAMPDTLRRLGFTAGDAAFRALTAEEQVPWAEKYFSPYRGKLVNSAACYVATFVPAYLGHAGDPDYVLVAKGGQLGWAFGPNAVFDANHDGRITVGELSQAIARNCTGPRWAEIVTRAGGSLADVAPDNDNDLGTTWGIQHALARHGFNPGVIDGMPGTKTREAVIAFQAANGLTPDGVVGPATRAALAA